MNVTQLTHQQGLDLKAKLEELLEGRPFVLIVDSTVMVQIISSEEQEEDQVGIASIKAMLNEALTTKWVKSIKP